jgi:CubicO group peptidase (beta-lactamase class C family)
VAHLERGVSFGNSTGSDPVKGLKDDRRRWSIWENPPRFDVDPLPANCRFWRAGEVPASNAIASAESLARLYGCLAQGGEINGVRVLDSSTIELAIQTIARGRDPFLDRELAFGIGFQTGGNPHPYGPEEIAFGHPGAGGSVHGAWPQHGIGFSYTPNMLLETAGSDPRAHALLDALHGCLATVQPSGGGK